MAAHQFEFNEREGPDFRFRGKQEQGMIREWVVGSVSSLQLALIVTGIPQSSIAAPDFFRTVAGRKLDQSIVTAATRVLGGADSRVA
jgi:hypothetical protein